MLGGVGGVQGSWGMGHDGVRRRHCTTQVYTSLPCSALPVRRLCQPLHLLTTPQSTPTPHSTPTPTLNPNHNPQPQGVLRARRHEVPRHGARAQAQPQEPHPGGVAHRRLLLPPPRGAAHGGAQPLVRGPWGWGVAGGGDGGVVTGPRHTSHTHERQQLEGISKEAALLLVLCLKLLVCDGGLFQPPVQPPVQGHRQAQTAAAVTSLALSHRPPADASSADLRRPRLTPPLNPPNTSTPQPSPLNPNLSIPPPHPPVLVPA